MKNKLLLTLAIACAFCFRPAFAQTADYISYNTTYGDVQHMIRTSDGGMAMLLYGMDQNPIIMKTTSNGTITWQQKVTFSGASVMFQVAETTDNGIVCLTSDNTGGIVIFKISAAGVYQWMKRYNYSASNQGWSLVGNDVGGVLIVGNGCAGHNFAIYTDASGNITWSKQYVDAAWASSTGSGVIKVSNTEYVITGLLINSSSQQATLMMSISNTGALNWFKEYDFGNGSPSGAKRVIKTADGGYSIVGYITVNAISGTYLIHTNSTGVLTWAKTYMFPLNSSCLDLIQESNGSYVLAGSVTHNGNQNLQEMLIHTDVNGSLLWARSDGNSYYNQAGYDGFNDIEYNSGTSFFASGASDGMVLWLMNDSTGFCHSVVETPTVSIVTPIVGTPGVSPTNITFTTTSPTGSPTAGSFVRTVVCTHPAGIDEAGSSPEISISPNPATQQVTLNFSSASLENGTLQIFDMMGNAVYAEKLPPVNGNFSEVLNLNLAAGMYTICITDGKQNYFSKLVVAAN